MLAFGSIGSKITVPVFFPEIFWNKRFCQHYVHWKMCVRIESTQQRIPDITANGQPEVGGQRPGRGRPCEEENLIAQSAVMIKCLKKVCRFWVLFRFEHRHAARI